MSQLLLDICYSILGMILLAGVVARVIWYLSDRSVYFPDRRICAVVHQKLGTWWEKSIEVLSYKPDVSAWGFVLTPIWFFLIGLNVLLLAQVLEVFFGEGTTRVLLPWVGSYTVVPIILGILVTMSVAVFAVLLHKLETVIPKILLTVLIVLMISGEAGLAWFRAFLITTGEEPISPTMMDVIIYRAGPVLAAVIAGAVATAEALTGRYGFIEFIEPMLTACIHWLGGIFSLIWCSISWWILGWHPIPPGPIRVVPKWYAELKQWLKELERKIEILRKDISGVRNGYRSLPNEPESLDSLRTRLQRIKVTEQECSNPGDTAESSHPNELITKTRLKWEADARKHKLDIETISSYLRVRQMHGRLKRQRFMLVRDLNELRSKALQLAREISRVPRRFHKRDNDFETVAKALKSSEERFTSTQSLLNRSLALFNSIDRIEFDSLEEGQNFYREFEIRLHSCENDLKKLVTDLESVRCEFDKKDKIRYNNKFSKEEHAGLTEDITSVIETHIPLLRQDGFLGLRNLQRLLKEKKKMIICDKLRSLLSLRGKKRDENSKRENTAILKLHAKQNSGGDG